MNEQVNIASVPDRELLVAEIFIDDQQLAEVNVEGGEPRVELYSRSDGEPWRLDFAQLVRLLERARSRLLEGGYGSEKPEP